MGMTSCDCRICRERRERKEQAHLAAALQSKQRSEELRADLRRGRDFIADFRTISEIMRDAPDQTPQDATEQTPATPRQYTFTEAELDSFKRDAIDKDRINGFLMFADALPEDKPCIVYGTSMQAKSIARALKAAGY